MRNKLAFVSLFVLMLVVWSTAGFAQTTEPTEISVDRYAFSFVVESNSLVTYPANGDGFSCVHNPVGGGKGVDPDYGLLVYGTLFHLFSTREAAEAGLDPPTETLLEGAEVEDLTTWLELYSAQMKMKGIEQKGQATINTETGKPIKVPYFTWAQTSRGKTHYALTYIVLHNDAFIHVQVESSKPLTDDQVEWFTMKLTLLEVESAE